MSGVDLLARGLGARALGRADMAARTGVYNRAALTAWHAALANRAAAPAKAVWLGDSITEGQGATSYGTRWTDRALAVLRARHPTPGVAGGIGYLPAMNAAGYFGTASEGSPYTSKTGSPTFLYGFGIGGKGAQLNASGDGLSFAINATSVEVWFVRTGGAGTLSIQIDGGAPVTIATASGQIGLTDRWTSPALAAGAHTVVVKSNGGGTVYLAGLLIYNGDEVAGIQGHEGGRAAAQASDFVNEFASFGGTGPGLQLIAPHLVTIAFGTNEYMIANAQKPIATFVSDLQALIAAVRARAPAASIALLGYSRRGDIAAAQAIGWEQYVGALYRVADADTGGLNGGSGVAVIDLSNRLPNAAQAGAPDPLGLYAGDRLHYGPAGHALIGEMVGAALDL